MLDLNHLIITGNSHVGEAVGIVVALILIICAVGCTVYFLHKKNVIVIKLSGGSPVFRSRSSKSNNDTQEIIQNEVVSDVNEVPSPISEIKPEVLRATSATETSPSFYEELRLGADGVGFKRLK